MNKTLRCALVSVAVMIAWLAASAGNAFAQSLVPVGARQLVVPFENASRDSRGYWLTEASAVLLTDDLIALGAEAITREDRLEAFDELRVPPIAALSHATVIRLGELVGAAQVVIGSFELKDDQLTVHARAIRLDSGRLFPEIVETGPLADLMPIFDRVARRLLPDSRVAVEQLAEGHQEPAAFEQYIKGVLAESPAAQISFLEQAIKLAPTFQRPRLALWQVHTDQGEHTQALAVVRGVPEDHAQRRRAQFLAALSLINLGQYPQAFDELTLLNSAKRDAALLNDLGVTQLRRPPSASGGKATAYFRDATLADPNDPDFFFNLGYAAWLDRDTQGAIAALREAVRRNAADDAAHYVLGVALQAAGSTAEAAREKELAKQLSSTYAEWEARQSGANPGGNAGTSPGAGSVPRGLERLKLTIDATLHLEDIIVAAGQRDQRELAQFHLDAGRRLAQAERDAEAIAELRRVIYLSPYNSEAHVLLGRLYLRSGRTADAIDALKIAIWSDPANAEAKRLLTEITPP
jgi:Flp pilus assembly protein TadD